MTEKDWLEDARPRQLVDWLQRYEERLAAGLYPDPPSLDRFRLWVEACRREFETNGSQLMGWVDLKKAEHQIPLCVTTWCREDHHQRPPLSVRADLLREVVPSPFRPPRWAAYGNPGSRNARPPWLTPDVLSLAAAADADRLPPDESADPVRLAVLADALEEAGCDDEEVVMHLRGWVKFVTSSSQCPICGANCARLHEVVQGNLRYSYACSGRATWVAPHSWVTPVAGTVVWRPTPCQHVPGCWALDLLLGRE